MYSNRENLPEKVFPEEETFRRIMDEDYYIRLMRRTSELAESDGGEQSHKKTAGEISKLEKAEIIDHHRSEFHSGLGTNIVGYYDHVIRKHRVLCIAAVVIVIGLIELTTFNMLDGGRIASEAVDTLWLFLFGT